MVPAGLKDGSPKLLGAGLNGATPLIADPGPFPLTFTLLPPAGAGVDGPPLAPERVDILEGVALFDAALADERVDNREGVTVFDAALAEDRVERLEGVPSSAILSK